MGIFDDKNIVVVSSVVYNLAGDELDRPNYLKSLVVRNVLSETRDSMAETIKTGYLYGPALKFKNFYNWASDTDNYGVIGIPQGDLTTIASLDPEDVAPAITHGPDQTPWVQSAQIGSPDPTMWAKRYILVNHPTLINTNWTVDYDPAENEITIFFEDSSTTTIAATGFDYEDKYIYAFYMLVKEDPQIGEIVEGSVVEIGGGAFPSITGYTLVSEDIEEIEVITDTGPQTYESGTRVYKRSVYTNTPSQLKETITYQTRFYDAELIDGDLELQNSYRIDTQIIIEKEFGPLRLLIYRIGSGNATLDALVSTADDYGGFFPYIPLRIGNEFLSDSYLPAAYAQAKRAYRKATGSKIEEIIAKIEDNDDLDDIDNAYVIFGVSLNTIEDASRKYVYQFLEKLQISQIGGPANYAAFLADWAEQEDIIEDWLAWKAAQGSGGEFTEQPPRPEFPQLPSNEIRINGRGASSASRGFDMRLQWRFVTNGAGEGQGKPGAKQGDTWIEHLGTDELTHLVYMLEEPAGLATDRSVQKFRIYWQRSDVAYTYLDVVGAVHQNFVYGGNSVAIAAKDALDDPEESGFIIPLHYETWREMAVKDRNQMATSCVFAVFNCYEIHKQRWWQRSIFRILLVVVIAIVSVVFTGGAGIGILGAHMAVGSALGLSGMTAAIVGSIANALAALVLATFLEKVTQGMGIFGQIIGLVFMFMLGQVVGSLHQTGALAINWGDLLRADNLLKLTSAVGNGVADMFNTNTAELGEMMLDVNKRAAEEARKIQQAFFDNIGYGAGVIDPFLFTDIGKGPVAESSSTFLTRTLMTGSEIAEMSTELLYGFPEFSLKLPDAFT